MPENGAFQIEITICHNLDLMIFLWIHGIHYNVWGLVEHEIATNSVSDVSSLLLYRFTGIVSP
jgi:hypothetical protein